MAPPEDAGNIEKSWGGVGGVALPVTTVATAGKHKDVLLLETLSGSLGLNDNHADAALSP